MAKLGENSKEKKFDFAVDLYLLIRDTELKLRRFRLSESNSTIHIRRKKMATIKDLVKTHGEEFCVKAIESVVKSRAARKAYAATPEAKAKAAARRERERQEREEFRKWKASQQK